MSAILAVMLLVVGILGVWRLVLWADRPRPTYAMQVPSEEFEPVHSVVRCRCGAMECTESLTLAKWKLLGPLDADKPAHWSCPACLRLKTPSKWEDT